MNIFNLTKTRQECLLGKIGEHQTNLDMRIIEITINTPTIDGEAMTGAFHQLQGTRGSLSIIIHEDSNKEDKAGTQIVHGDIIVITEVNTHTSHWEKMK